MSEKYFDKCDEIVLGEPDETGNLTVLKDGKFYYKKTFKYDNATVNVYNPIFKDDGKQKRKNFEH